MSKKLPYVVSQVPYKDLDLESKIKNKKVYYCHMRDFPYIAVWGSVGSYKNAKAMCDLYNQTHKGE